MAKFHLMHCVPHPRMHGLNGYMEVIESVDWGLKQLGHEVTYSLNKYDPLATNIIFGAQVLPIDFLKQLPNSTIVYNFEILDGYTKDQLRPQVHFCAEHFQIWEYSKFNLDTWKLFGVDSAEVVPVGYAPTLTRIPKFNIQDIDLLIYGLSGDTRLMAFHKLSIAGFKIVFVSGLYGQARDVLIARSKIVLNINKNAIFEIVRASYLLANKKAVVATLDPKGSVEEDMIDAIKFTTIEKIVDDCAQLIERDDERSKLEIVGFEKFIKRDIKEILRGALN